MSGLNDVERRLKQMGLELPVGPTPIASFLPYRISRGTVYLAGQTCEWDGAMLYEGRVGVEVDLESAIKAARVCALNLLASLRDAVGGDFGRVAQCVRVGGFVQVSAGFQQVPQVINGASDLFIALFGDAGRHARTAIGVASLPLNAAVEVDAIFELSAGA